MQNAILAAEYTNGTRHAEPTLTINWIANGERTFVSMQAVSGKREARAISKSLSAKDWNY